MLEEALRQTKEYQRLREALAGGRSPVALFGLPPAARAQVAVALAADLGRPAVVLTAGEAEATRFAADAAFFGARSAVCPARDFALRPTLGQSREFEYRRIAVLGNIVGGRCNLLEMCIRDRAYREYWRRRSPACGPRAAPPAPC